LPKAIKNIKIKETTNKVNLNPLDRPAKPPKNLNNIITNKLPPINRQANKLNLLFIIKSNEQFIVFEKQKVKHQSTN
jgi:hypothetical protein